MNFLTYDTLSNDEAAWLLSEDVRPFLDKARATLFRKGRGRKSYYKTPQDFQHTLKQIERINSIIIFDLELIGRYSNSRFGKSAREQYRFFQRPGEQETFLIHLFIAVQARKREIVTAGNEAPEKEFCESKVQDSHMVLRMWEDKSEVYFKTDEESFSEKQLYAAGVFYMINFLLIARGESEGWRYKRLMERLAHFAEGTSYFVADGKKGGQKRGEERRGKKEKVYALFCEQNLYEKVGPKVEALLSEMKGVLRKKRISVPKATLKTRWIPEFVKRKKSIMP